MSGQDGTPTRRGGARAGKAKRDVKSKAAGKPRPVAAAGPHGTVRLYAVTPDGAHPLEPPAGARDVHELLDDQPLGIYEGLRTFGASYFLGLERHMDRADRSMALLGWKDRLDRALLSRALDEACRAWNAGTDGSVGTAGIAGTVATAGAAGTAGAVGSAGSVGTAGATSTAVDARVRFDVLAQPPHGLDTDSRMLLAISPHDEPSAEELRDGVGVGIALGKHRLPPRIKQARWVIERRGTGPGDRGYFEHLLVDDDGGILECTSANFFAVRGGALVTAATGMLEGVTRSFILELAAAAGILVELRSPRLDELPELDEAFLTSASRNCIPVVTVEGLHVGGGRPGPVTAQLRRAYQELAAREARPALANASS